MDTSQFTLSAVSGVDVNIPSNDQLSANIESRTGSPRSQDKLLPSRRCDHRITALLKAGLRYDFRQGGHFHAERSTWSEVCFNSCPIERDGRGVNLNYTADSIYAINEIHPTDLGEFNRSIGRILDSNQLFVPCCSLLLVILLVGRYSHVYGAVESKTRVIIENNGDLIVSKYGVKFFLHLSNTCYIFFTRISHRGRRNKRRVRAPPNIPTLSSFSSFPLMFRTSYRYIGHRD